MGPSDRHHRIWGREARRPRAWGAPLVGILAAAVLVNGPLPGESELGSRVAPASVIVEPPSADAGIPLAPQVTTDTDRASEPRPEPLARPLVVLYGDSLAWSARDAFAMAFALSGKPEIEVVTRTWGGTAICDWLGPMASDATELEPGAVVIQFSGNSLTPCMEDENGNQLTGDAYFAQYQTDAEAAIGAFAGTNTQVILAGAPRAPDALGSFKGSLVNAIYERLARTHDGVRYADAGASVLRNGGWTETLPCLPAEPCTGGTDEDGIPINVVRAPDGAHFCPVAPSAVRGVTDDCPVWSSGAFRYGMALAHPVIESIDTSGSRAR